MNINQVCYECGVSANVLTFMKLFAKRPLHLHYSVSTYHRGTCDVCKEEKDVTEPRDFFYPDFTLLTSETKHKCEEDWYGNCYNCGRDMLKEESTEQEEICECHCHCIMRSLMCGSPEHQQKCRHCHTEDKIISEPKQAILEEFYKNEYLPEGYIVFKNGKTKGAKEYVLELLHASKEEGYKQGCEEQRKKMVKEISALCGHEEAIDCYGAIITYLKNNL